MLSAATLASIVSIVVGLVTLGAVLLKTGIIMARISQLREDLKKVAVDLEQHKKDNADFHLKASERLVALETRTGAAN